MQVLLLKLQSFLDVLNVTKDLNNCASNNNYQGESRTVILRL